MTVLQGDPVLHVRSRTTGALLFEQHLGQWFSQDMTARALHAAGAANPPLRGKRLSVNWRTVEADDGGVLGWRCELCDGGVPVHRQSWPIEVLRPTALAVAQQVQKLLVDARVDYWVSREPAGEQDGDDGQIEFEVADGPELLEVPDIPTRSDASVGRVILPAAHAPVDVVLKLHQGACAALLSGIQRPNPENREIAWAGDVEVWRPEGQDFLVYETARLQPLDAPQATAQRCPISPEEIVRVLPAGGPVVFVHTHITPDGDPGEGADSRRSACACSQDDLRSFHRLPVGSLGLVVASRPPLCVRAYGYPTDGGDLGELSLAVTLAQD